MKDNISDRKNESEEKLAELSMKIILNAGDARNLINEALKKVEESRFEDAEIVLKNAKKYINTAHSAQTNTIQNEAKGNKTEFSLLFAHAQDTLMTVMSELNTAKNLLRLFKKFDSRLAKLEDILSRN